MGFDPGHLGAPMRIAMKIAMKRLTLIVLLMLNAISGAAENPTVVIKTTTGNITLLLDAGRAPISVANFLSYVDDDGYRGSIFHRVIEGFMVQAGGMLEDMSMLDEKENIRNEADNGLRNKTGTIAFARMNQIDSASRQFFINVNDNASLDHTAKSCTRKDEEKQRIAREKGLFRPVSCKTFGYAVFGHVIKGMDIVRNIELAEVGSRKGFEDVPVQPVIIKIIERLTSN